MSNYLKILETCYGGRSKSDTARICGCSRTTVDSTLALARAHGLIDVASLQPHTEESLARLLHPKVYERTREQGYMMPDYADVHRDLAKPHVTLQLLWEEYVLRSEQAGARYYSETQFRKYYHAYANDQKVTVRLKHKPGYAMQVDWAGTKFIFHDEEIGEETAASLFVAALPYSHLVYAEPFRHEKSVSWLTAHVNAFSYFGGAPKVLVPDNLKTGVKKPEFYEPELQRQYSELADYYGAAVLPARIRRPKDKGAVENAVLQAQRRILAKLRNLQIRSFEELQLAIREKLDALNDDPLTGREVSRRQVYDSEERMYMQKLPEHVYEYAEWKSNLVVAPDCHVSFQRKHYSVPYEYVGKTVEIRATERILEIFYHHDRIASHRRSFGSETYITDPDHIPPGRAFFLSWDRERFLHWAQGCGAATVRVMTGILDRAIVEEQAHRACHGLVRLGDKHGVSRVEAACRQACQYSQEPTYRMVKQLVAEKQPLPTESQGAEQRPRGYRRGAEYFGGHNNAD